MRRDEKLAAFRAGEIRRKRGRRIGIGAAIVGVVAAGALLVASIVLAPQRPPSATYTGSPDASITGLNVFANGATHVDTPVTYAQTPPAGGNHSQIVLNCGVYTEPVPNENAVHSLEHGAVWVTYSSSLSEQDLTALRALIPSSYAILSPFEGLPSPIVLSAWNAQLEVTSPNDERIVSFFEKYWQSPNAPEPGAPCSGGVTGGGRV